MNAVIFSNAQIYRDIAEDAFHEMEKHLTRGRRRSPDGDGWIITLDPSQKSFKSALIFLVFSGMWLEATLHLLIVKRHGKSSYRKVDKQSYEAKLRLLGVGDETLYGSLAEFRTLRRELLHEKAHYDQNTLRIAQDEAIKVRVIMDEVAKALKHANM